MSTAKTKESFVMYDSFLEAADFLPAEDFKVFILKLRDYALYGNEEPSDNKTVNALFTMAKPNLDAAEKRRKQSVENGNKGKEFGKTGGRMRNGETREEYDERRLSRNENPQETPNEPLNVNVNDNVEVNVNANENEKVDVKGNGKANETGVMIDENHDTPSLPVSSPSFSSSFGSFSNENPNQIVNKDTLNSTCNDTIEIKREKNNNSDGSCTAAAGEGKLSDYYHEMFDKSVAILKRYRLNNTQFDETYKTAHHTACQCAMELWGYNYDAAKQAINSAVSDWVNDMKDKPKLSV